jgi:NAD(P)-dependent dehydrogenase (short-subunit alcohol dehydrogenase family)
MGMRILVVGGTGTIGRAVTNALEGGHEVLTASRNSGDFRVDISAPESITALFQQTGKVDAVISCAGNAAFKPLTELTDEDVAFSLGNKLMGQVNLVRLGLPSVTDAGSFTLTGGLLAQEPTPGGTALSMVNAALEGFARGAALDLPRQIRINVVSPPWVSETLTAMGMDPSIGIPAAAVAKAYLASLQHDKTGQVLDAREYA